MPKAPKYTNKSQRDRPPPKVPIAETLAKAEAAAASPYARPASNKEKKRKRIEQKGEIHKTGAFFYVPEPRKKRKKTTGVSGERGEGGGEEAEPGVEENEEEEEEELDEAQKYLLSVRKEVESLPSFTVVPNPYQRPSTSNLSHPTNPSTSSSNTGHPSTSAAPREARKVKLGFYVAPPDASVVPLTEEEEDERDLRRDPIVPTKRWRKIWARRLGDLRSNLNHPSTQARVSTPGWSTSPNPLPHYLPIPLEHQRSAWRAYIMGAKRRKLTRREIGERDEAVLQAAVASEQGMDAAGGAGKGGDEEEMGMNDEEVEEEELAMNEGDGMEGEEARGGAEEWFGEEGDEFEDEFVDGPIQGGDDEDEDGSEEEEEEDDGVVAEEDLEPFEIRHEPKEPSLTLIQTLSQEMIIALIRHISYFVTDRPAPKRPKEVEQHAASKATSSDPSFASGLISTQREPSPPASSSSASFPIQATELAPTISTQSSPSSFPIPAIAEPTASTSTAPTLPHRETHLPPLLTRWLLSLLSKLDSHLPGESVSHLRTLARACLEVLVELKTIRDARAAASLAVDDSEGKKRAVEGGEKALVGGEVRLVGLLTEEEEEEVMGCWMVWESIVAGPWTQKDLREEEEKVFGKR